jgi:hypothetical protein
MNRKWRLCRIAATGIAAIIELAAIGPNFAFADSTSARVDYVMRPRTR